jgi:hypothetical protein
VVLIEELIAAKVPAAEIERLLQHWGGLPLYVPSSIRPDHPLVTRAGPALAAALVRRYGGERVLVPLGAAFRRAMLARRVLELKAAGLNHCEIARRLGLHLRQVQRIVARRRP